MADRSRNPRPIALTLPPEEHWTLHHVLLDRITQEPTADDPATVDPPPIEVFLAFETLDAGDTQFTIAQLEAMQTVLADYHHTPTWWEIDAHGSNASFIALPASSNSIKWIPPLNDRHFENRL